MLAPPQYRRNWFIGGRCRLDFLDLHRALELALEWEGEPYRSLMADAVVRESLALRHWTEH